MNPEDDPFAIFQRTQQRVQPTGTVSKKVHLDSGDVRISMGAKKLQDGESQEQGGRKKLEEIEIEVERNDEGCIHEVFYPKDYIRKQFNGPCNAHHYPFKLDPFQQKAVRAIESDESVLVCAHTSAGKTAVAQYAIATCMNNNSRVIYTSPIKALSNQKYRELKKKFEDVGLVTGDTTLDQNSSCLVMTTQILRNMIYRGNEIVREVKWVIFDEVHYMRDKERGVVWEETIIMMPSNVKYVFLSATIGNPEQFASWITKLRKQPCNVVYTDYRPVPLEHYLCPAGGEGLYLVVDDTGKFHDSQFNKAVECLGESVNVIGMNQKKKKNVNQGSDLAKIIKVIMQRSMDPAIIFSFSKKDVEAYARSIVSKYDLTTKEEKQKIRSVFNDAIEESLAEEDRDLPPITSMKGIIEKGIGIHHGGLLPLVKEIIEVLFQAGLIKILFSTETFSMGVNMPAKTVVFTSVRKFDGEVFRWIGGGEYIQMSGRAGRRGLDKKGITILMLDQKMEPEAAKSMLKGKSDNLLSSFYISYNMLLNSQRLEDIDPEYILARTLLQFQKESTIPEFMQAHQAQLEKYEQTKIDNQEQLQTLYILREKIETYQLQIKKLTFVPNAILPYLHVGRVIRVKANDGKEDWGYGYMINFKREKSKKVVKNDEGDNAIYIADIMIYIKKKPVGEEPQPTNIDDPEGEMAVLAFSMDCIWEITSIKISEMPTDLTANTSKNLLHDTLKELLKRKLQTIQIKSSKPEVKDLRSKVEQLEKESDPYQHLMGKMSLYKEKRQLYEQIKQMSKKIKEAKCIVLKKEKKAYIRVIKRVGLVEKGVVTRKGNVACEISGNHEILLTELLFAGFFNDLSPAEISAILSTLLNEERSSTNQKTATKSPKFKKKLQELIVQAKKVFSIFRDCKVAIEQDEYLESIKEQLVDVTYEWCNGATFAQICKMSQAYEGSIIRMLRRLHELLKQMVNAAKVIGNEQLSQKFEQAGEKVFRGMVRAASLYTV